MTAPTWQSEDGRVSLWLADCLTVLPTLGAGSVDVVITDPPYGIGYDASHQKYKNGICRNEATWDDKPFDPTPILNLGLPTILWGGNCFASKLPDYPGWLSWVKVVRNNADVRQADMELAWTNCVARPRNFTHLWVGAYRDSESGIKNVHPTQKPIALMKWCVEIVSNPNETILDPFMGSGTTGVAAVKLGRKFWGIEMNAEYFAIAQKRIEQALAQPALITL